MDLSKNGDSAIELVQLACRHNNNNRILTCQGESGDMRGAEKWDDRQWAEAVHGAPAERRLRIHRQGQLLIPCPDPVNQNKEPDPACVNHIISIPYGTYLLFK